MILESLLALFLTQGPTQPAPGVPTLDLEPSQVIVTPGSLFRVKAKTSAAVVFFDVEGISTPPDDWPLSDRKTSFYGVAPTTPGQFTLTATVYGNEHRTIKKVAIIVGTSPVPPGPNPGPPKPNDPLFDELQKLFTENDDPAKLSHARSLASLYSTAGMAALKDETVASTGQFLLKLKAAAKLLLPDTALPKIRDRLRDEFALCLGTADTPLTPELREKASKCLVRLSQLIEALK